ncbi:MAG TPA: 2-amino-4-hydroxy-6-hydroxymethyldihydropteridine diphosphokinase [Xanthomonadaceae bacterium]|jgi:2-amino-4-hydroxy-6-hydroxymethyldihydropteridine diphosphokinase
MSQQPLVQACIGLGANLGDAADAIAGAFDALASLPATRLLRRSRLYRTPAWGVIAQPDFINAAALVETSLGASELLAALLRIERQAGRDRSAQAGRWGPRVLDLDLLLYGNATIAQDGLRIPHPHLHERAFVLVPLAEIAPDANVPGHGRVDVLLSGLDAKGIVALADRSSGNSENC